MAVKAKMPAVIKRVQKIAKNAKPPRLRQVMRHVAGSMRRDVVRAFGDERAPEVIHDDVRHLAGQRWEPLAPSTLAGRGRKARWAKGRKRTRHTRSLVGKKKALQDTGLMRRSIRESVESRGQGKIGAFTGIKGAAFYTEFHQFGRGRIPARPFVGVMRRTIDQALQRIMRFITKK